MPDTPGLGREFFSRVADDIHRLFFPPAPPANLQRAQEQLRLAVEMADQREQAGFEWQRSWIQHYERIRKEPALRKKRRKPPGEGWKWVDDIAQLVARTRGQVGLEHVKFVGFAQHLVLEPAEGHRYAGWIPPHLLRPPTLPPSPMPGEESPNDAPEAALVRQYVILACVHDGLDTLRRRNRGRLLDGVNLQRPWLPATPLGAKMMMEGMSSVGRGFNRKTVEQALEAVATDLAADPSCNADTPVTLREFMEQYCVPMNKGLRKSRRDALQRLARRRQIQLPSPIGDWHSGKGKYYRPSDLIKQWASYQKKFRGLPSL